MLFQQCILTLQKKLIFTLQENYDKAADDATECKNQPLYFN